MIIPVQRVGQIGLVTDLPHDEIPLNAWTDGKNVRFRGGAVEKFSGHASVFGTPLVQPKWLFHTGVTGTPLWLYASDTNVAATDGAIHAEVTRASGVYTKLPKIPWTGGEIEGIPLINNGFDIPQMWNKPALSTLLADMTNWPANMRAMTLRTFKRHVLGFDITLDGVRYPTMIRWSDQAPTGAVPLSWDITDETIDAGEWILPDKGGFIVDFVPLRDVGIIYRENELWQMQYSPDTAIFRFTRLFENIGVLTRDCAKEFFSGKHVIFTGDDIVLMEGVSAKSILDERHKKAINIDLANYDKSFVAVDYANKEVLTCFPEPGREYASKAVVWNWVTDTFGVRELPDAASIEPGIVLEGAVSDTWDEAVGVWDTDNVAWGDRTSDPTKRRLLMGSPSRMSLYAMGLTQQFALENMEAFVERRGLGFPVQVNQPPDYTRMKQITNLWPKITGSEGGVLNVYLGIQKDVSGPVTWGAARSFTIGTDTMLDFSDLEASRLHALRIESQGNLSWRLSGYDVDVIDRGSL